ncbi:Peptide transporter family 1 [Astathelohania contejeani]|uniref:Peptide transporter family 1 n=1 Tax=Astathelohania contejeani TaxID=164912 RepID=A0ABQ7HZ24_9MICR|nr:Peptide transporter family 1 [Thelohania contejeani]
MLSDQSYTTWRDQGIKMDNNIQIGQFNLAIKPLQIHSSYVVFSSIMNMFFYFYLFPKLKKHGYNPNSLFKMALGVLLSSISFMMYIIVEIYLNKGIITSIFWQLPQFFFMATGEVLLGVNGIEFVYSESHAEVKCIVYSGWIITIAIGNFLVAIFSMIKIGTYIGNVINYHNAEIIDGIIYILFGIIGFCFFYWFSRIYKFKNQNFYSK